MIEKEVKLRIKTSIEDVKRVIDRYGFRFIDRYTETDTYFQHPCRDFRESDEALRIRYRCSSSTGCIYRLTYKGPKKIINGVKYRDEYEIEINDIDNTITILKSLGFKPVLSFSKIRYIYRDRDIEISIDNLCGVGIFMEIEGSEDRVRELMKIFIEFSEIIEKTYLEICVDTGRCISISMDREDMCIEKQLQ